MENVPVKQDATVAAVLNQVAVKARFEAMLGKKAAGFMSSIISATQGNKLLKKADPASVVAVAAVAASLDLPVNPSLGFAYIVPYAGQAQFQIGWRGLVQLAMRSGQYRTINVTNVYEGELISSNRFTGEMEFSEGQRTSDTIIGYVAYFKLINGFEKWLYMTTDQVRAHGKKYSKSYNSPEGKWKTDFEAMALKTPIKLLLSKFGILSIEMQTAVQVDQAIVKKDGSYAYDDNEAIDAEITEQTKEITEVLTPEQWRTVFDDSIPKDADPVLVAEFLSRIAAQNKKTVDDVKITSAGDPKELAALWKLFPAWCKQQAKATTTASSEAPVARFECPNDLTFVTIEICEKCKSREPHPGDICPAYSEHAQAK